MDLQELGLLERRSPSVAGVPSSLAAPSWNTSDSRLVALSLGFGASGKLLLGGRLSSNQSLDLVSDLHRLGSLRLRPAAQGSFRNTGPCQRPRSSDSLSDW